jgi:hypothetical protein
MTAQAIDQPRRPSAGFRVVTAVVAGTLAALLLWGLQHQSDSPTVFSRYSPAYAAVLGVLLVLLLVCLWALWREPAWLVRALGNAFLAAGSLAISLLLLEAGLRLVNPWGMDFFHWLPYHMQGMVDHPDLGYTHPRSVSYRLGRNRVTLNSHGLRDKEISYEKPAGERRILLLGDSVTFGWGVSDGEPFADRLEELLAARTRPRWEVINAGVNGYNAQQEATYFRSEGIRYQPDIVLLTFLDNDLDAVIDPNVTTWRRYPSWPESLPEAFSRLRSLSYTFQATQMFLRARQLGAQRTGEIQEGSGRGITGDPRWPAARTHLQEIAELCRARGIRFMVLTFGNVDPGLHSELASLGIRSLSLGDAFARVPQGDVYVSKVDPHPSPAAHRAIAEFLFDELSSRRMLD